MNFKIKSLEDLEFSELFNVDNLELEKIGAVQMTVDLFPGFLCRVSLEDAEIPFLGTVQTTSKIKNLK